MTFDRISNGTPYSYQAIMSAVEWTAIAVTSPSTVHEESDEFFRTSKIRTLACELLAKQKINEKKKTAKMISYRLPHLPSRDQPLTIVPQAHRQNGR